jgi:hypothetical protein
MHCSSKGLAKMHSALHLFPRLAVSCRLTRCWSSDTLCIQPTGAAGTSTKRPIHIFLPQYRVHSLVNRMHYDVEYMVLRLEARIIETSSALEKERLLPRLPKRPCCRSNLELNNTLHSLFCVNASSL